MQYIYPATKIGNIRRMPIYPAIALFTLSRALIKDCFFTISLGSTDIAPLAVTFRVSICRRAAKSSLSASVFS